MSGRPWRSKRATQQLECLKCETTMQGIFCYSVREVCQPCGGKSLTENKELQDATIYETA